MCYVISSGPRNQEAESGYARMVVADPIENGAADPPTSGRGQVKIKRISEASQNAEDKTYINRVFDCLVADTGSAHLVNVSSRDFGRRKG